MAALLRIEYTEPDSPGLALAELLRIEYTEPDIPGLALAVTKD